MVILADFRGVILTFLMVFFFLFFFQTIIPKFQEIRLELEVENNLSSILEHLVMVINDSPPLPVGGSGEYFKYELYLEKAFFIEERTILFEYRFRDLIVDNYDHLSLEFIKDLLVDFSVKMFDNPSSVVLLRNRDIVIENVFFDSQKIELFRISYLLNTPITVISEY